LLAICAPSFQMPCRQISSKHDKWVRASIDELVRSSHAAYEDDDAFDKYEDVLGALSRTVRRCRLTEDAELSEHYRDFLGYVDEASLALKPDHKLGFNVPDTQYFAETIQYLGIPRFLLEPQFLHDVSRIETLARAKEYLRQLNGQLSSDEKLIFFSYTSRHLGTPDNNDS